MDLLVFAIALVAFACYWVACISLIAWLGGWMALARQFASAQRPEGVVLRFEHIQLNWCNYGGCVTIVVAREGLYLEVWRLFSFCHRPLLLPWSVLTNPRAKKFLWIEYVTFDIDTKSRPRLNVMKRVIDLAMQHYGGDAIAKGPMHPT